MRNLLLAGLLFNFTALAAIGIQMRKDDFRSISAASQQLSIPLKLCGFLGTILAIYCFVAAQEWIAGLAMWGGSAFLLALVAVKLRDSGWDGFLTLMGFVTFGFAGWLLWASLA